MTERYDIVRFSKARFKHVPNLIIRFGTCKEYESIRSDTFVFGSTLPFDWTELVEYNVKRSTSIHTSNFTCAEQNE